MTTVIKKAKSGGFRPGSGRPKGTGKYREATEPLRVPRGLVPQIKDLLAYYLEEKRTGQSKSAASTKPFPLPRLAARNSHINHPTHASPPSPFTRHFVSASNSASDLASNSAFPLYATRVAAGFPSPADDHIEAKLDLNEHLVKHPAATFFVRVEGESMIGAGIFPNDILVVDRSLKPSHGKVVIAVVNGELTVKRLEIGKGTLRLLAENIKYPAIQITEEMNFSIWGVVTNVIHAL